MKKVINFKIKRICVCCNKIFKVRSSQQKMCCECRLLNCVTCGQKFEVEDYSAFKRRKYCTKSCQPTKHNLGIYAEKGVATPWNKGKSSLPHCFDCRVELKDYRSQRCRHCTAKFEKRLVGSKNPSWKNGITKSKNYSRNRVKKWRNENPDKNRFLLHRARARRMGAEGLHTLEEWGQLKRLFDYTCLSCRKKEPEIKLTEDHIVALIAGGSDNIENIQPLCGSCNSKKHIKTIDFRDYFIQHSLFLDKNML